VRRSPADAPQLLSFFLSPSACRRPPPLPACDCTCLSAETRAPRNAAVLEIIDRNHGIVSSTTGSNYYVRILSTINRELLKPGASVALHRHSNAVVDVLPPEADSAISMLGADEKPNISYNDIGGCDQQKQEMREAVELPLTRAHHRT